MREIKFRAWDKEKKTMGVPFTLQQAIKLRPFTDPTDNCLYLQFLGKKDKNGEEICEGDILATKFFPEYMRRICWDGPPDAICEVYWDFVGFGLKAKGEKDFRYPPFHDINLDNTVVIGNIHENPELLDKKIKKHCFRP